MKTTALCRKQRERTVREKAVALAASAYCAFMPGHWRMRAAIATLVVAGAAAAIGSSSALLFMHGSTPAASAGSAQCKAITTPSMNPQLAVLRFVADAVERRNLGDAYTTLFVFYKRWYHLTCAKWLAHPLARKFAPVDYTQSGARYTGGGDMQAIYQVFLHLKGEPKGTEHWFDIELRETKEGGPWYVDYWKLIPNYHPKLPAQALTS